MTQPSRALNGSTAIVTGASSGIGLAVAQRLAADGAAVVVNYHSHREAADALVSEIREHGGTAIAVWADVSREGDVSALFDEAVQAFGRVDILVANSGAQKDAAIADMTLDQWRAVISQAIEFVCSHWKDRDAGIWELRGNARHLLHSRLMCWVAIDRAMRLANKRSLAAPTAQWGRERDRISADIWDNFRHPEKGYFVQERGGTELDAALLMMPLVRFVSATDPCWLATLEAIGEQLGSDGMLWRYRGDDGLPGSEGAFTACSFWYVECLARAGRLDQARLEMEKALGYANHLGLFSEELDRVGRQLGNFPQALTHLAFISAAFFLDRRIDDPGGGEWQP